MRAKLGKVTTPNNYYYYHIRIYKDATGRIFGFFVPVPPTHGVFYSSPIARLIYYGSTFNLSLYFELYILIKLVMCFRFYDKSWPSVGKTSFPNYSTNLILLSVGPAKHFGGKRAILFLFWVSMNEVGILLVKFRFFIISLNEA